MNTQASSGPKSTTQTASKAHGAAPTPIQPPAQIPQLKIEEEAPTFETIRDYLRGRECVLISPPMTAFTRSYCNTKKDTDAGTFNCRILDVIVDGQGKPVSAVIEYKEKGSRLYGARDVISLEGISISTAYSLPSVKDAVEEAIAAESATKH